MPVVGRSDNRRIINPTEGDFTNSPLPAVYSN